MQNYQTLIRTIGSAYGDRIAIEDAFEAFSFADLHARTSELAAGLLALGLEKGDSVMWLSPNRASYLLAYFATAKAGLRFSPLNFWLRNNELQAAIELVAPKCIIAAQEFTERLDEVCDGLDLPHRVELPFGERDAVSPGWLVWSELFSETEADAHFDSDEDTPHEIIFTSGTTGQVKGVTRTQRQRIMEAVVSIVVNPLGFEPFVLMGAPQFHVGGGTGPLQALIQGGRCRIYKFSPREMAEHLKQGVTHFSAVPAHFQILFESGCLDDVDTSAIRHIGIGGNGAAPEQFLQVHRAFPNANLVHFYGSTESGMVTCIKGPEFLGRLRSIGRPAPGVDVRIADDNDQPLPQGEIGEIQARSEHQMIEYYRREDVTADAVTDDGYLRMGDLGTFDADGYLYVVGRKKDMIISGGENIYPKEVEDLASGVPGVAECAVIGVPDEIFEERVIAVVKPVQGLDYEPDELTDRIVTVVRAELAGYKAPKEVHFVEDFPRNALGKINKVALRAEYGGAGVGR